jgi:AcrR family transcriptional regulator
MTTRVSEPDPAPRLRHEALVYASDDAFVARLGPFLREGLEADQPTIVVLAPAKAALLREELGRDALHVTFSDAGTWYRRPAQAIADYRQFLEAELTRPGVEVVRVIGEVEFGSTAAEHAGWARYESMFNHGFARYPVSVVCGYDTRILPEDVVAGAHCTHPVVSMGGSREASAGYLDPDELVGLPDAWRRERGGHVLARFTATTDGDLGELQRAVAGSARAAGLEPAAVGDATIAAAELVRDALARGAEHATVELARDGARWFCEVSGRNSGVSVRGDTGLSIARLISDPVEVSRTAGRESVRLTFSGAADARQRILDAASELFYQHGIRATGVNAVVAHSGVAKATFFRHFPAKNDLVVDWLRQSAPRWFDRIRAELDAGSEPPAGRLLAFFDLLGEWFTQPDFRGCAFQNAAAEIAEPDHPVRLAVRDYLLEIRDYLRRTAIDAGLPHPADAAEQLHVLAQGAIAAAVAARSPEPASVARSAAEQLLKLAA